MDSMLCIQAFVRVAETKSFASAARQLGVTPSVITTRIKQLEHFLQAPLFHRSTRQVLLSESAAGFFQECVEMLARFESITDRMRLTNDSTSGLLRLQVLLGFALGPLSSALEEFCRLYPDIRLEITVADPVGNPINGGHDVSLQIFRPGAELLIERRLFTVRRYFCASPAYLKRHGTPLHPTDLLKHRLALYSAYPTRHRWTFGGPMGELILELPAHVISNSVNVLRDFALTGSGITCVPTMICSQDLIQGSLVPILLDYEIANLDFLAMYPAALRGNVKVKLFVDFLAKRLAGETPWDKALRQLPALGKLLDSRLKNAAC